MKSLFPQSSGSRAAGALAITGAKGGIGKSNLTVNLAVALGKLGRKVLVVDGDLGLANLDVLLGLVPDRTVEHLIRGEAELSDLLLEGPAGIQVLPAASGVPDLARMTGPTREALLGALVESGGLADEVLIDTGAGLGETTVSLQIAAARVIVVTTPEPTSLVDAYATLKVIWSADPDKPVDLVVNNTRDDDEARQAFEQITRASKHFLGKRPGWLGAVDHDPKLIEAVRRQTPVLELDPSCRASRCYERIAMNLASIPASDGSPAAYWERLMEIDRKEMPN